MFLDADELLEFTGYHHAKRQIQWLRENRIPHIVNGAGLPRVARAYVEKRLVGKPETEAPAARPDFGALRRVV